MRKCKKARRRGKKEARIKEEKTNVSDKGVVTSSSADTKEGKDEDGLRLGIVILGLTGLIVFE